MSDTDEPQPGNAVEEEEDASELTATPESPQSPANGPQEGQDGEDLNPEEEQEGEQDREIREQSNENAAEEIPATGGEEPEDNTAGQPTGSPCNTGTPRLLQPQKRITINPEKYPLNLKWALGINQALPVISLLDSERLEIAYGCSNVAVIFDHTSNSQHIFQGHYNPISCLCVSEDRRWLVTADKGPDSLVLIWETHTGFPVQTLFGCHPEGGVSGMALSHDSKYLVTVGAGEIQRVCVWDWTSEADGPVCATEIQPGFGCQSHVVFHPNDSTQFLSNSRSQVVFYRWDTGELEYSAPALSDKTFKKKVGSFSQSLFHCEGMEAFSGTLLGNVVVWDVVQDSASQVEKERRALKLIPLQKHGITVLTRTDRCIVTGNTRGHVTFYDEHLKLIKWYDKFNLDPITSISFSKETNGDLGNQESYLKDDRPSVMQNFVLSTDSATVVHVNTQSGQLQVVLRENSGALHAVACHPTLPILTTGSYCGILRAWDYQSLGPICSRAFHTERQIHCLAYDPRGFYLAAGFTCGTVYILDAIDLHNKPENRFRCANDGITHITFSHDSHYLATADTAKAVTVYRLCPQDGKLVWDFQWRHRYHYEPIQDLLFGVYPGSTQPRLLSLGMDRRLVEYDLKNSGEADLRILSTTCVEQSAVPTCMAWYPPFTSEELLLTASHLYKMKLFNTTTKMCRKTLLGPTHSSPIQKISVLPPSPNGEPSSHYLAYIAHNKLGLQILPVDGNPCRYSALICHPAGISHLACSNDGRYIFTSGGTDCTVCCWEINLRALEAEAALGGRDLVPFYSLLEGGKDGQLFKDITDYFYYCQLRIQGIDSMEPRRVSTRIPLSELPVMMRALGFFPTHKEIEDMQNEVKYSRYAETGEIVTDIDLDEFIKLYINHRPVVDRSREDLQHAFSVLGQLNERGERVIKRDEMLHLLQTRGEPMTEEELAECFAILLGANVEGGLPELGGFDCKDSADLLESVLPEEISLETFIVDILGWPASAKEPPHTETGAPHRPEAQYQSESDTP
ncbi:hypothetical protein AGOR_G00057410 [Albula goreensis]|uniref:Cilia- and flagella-associated protein 251 n=1 Tax=Albula goreensis TaxID=1534307 RepID=A0A8T3E2P8_9TELE|nr:hypothetical protein AGOR_G00057410 [Albula goreensis]